MSRLFPLSTVALLLLGSTAWAGENILTVETVTYPPGTEQAEIEVTLSNEDEVVGFQFDLLIPDALTPSDRDDNPATWDAASLGSRTPLSDSTAGWMLSGADKDYDLDDVIDGVRVVGFTMALIPIPPGSDTLVTFYFDIAADAAGETYGLEIEQIVFSGPDAIEVPHTAVAGSIAIDDPDGDSDGYPMSQDCDDTDASINPGATEIPYDFIDQDCDGADLTDVDGDTYIAEEVGGDDCDDDDATSYPGADEIAYDGIDQDCDGADITDIDGDGYDSDEAGGDDCNDIDPNVNPGVEEILDDGIDQDCDGVDATSNTGDTGDTGDTEDTGDEKPDGCGCATGAPLPPTGLAGLLMFATLLRRRRSV